VNRLLFGLAAHLAIAFGLFASVWALLTSIEPVRPAAPLVHVRARETGGLIVCQPVVGPKVGDRRFAKGDHLMFAFLASSALAMAFKGGVGAVAGRALGHAGADAKAIGSRINWQGWLGLIAAAVLGVMLIVQKGETRHWRKQSGQFETLYHNEQTAFAQTVANYRTAAEEARRKDAANKVRVEAEQSAISERTSHDFEIRIADARARARRLQPAQGAADPGGGRATALPGVRAAAGGAAEASGEGRLPASDALTATEQAIQLDELIKWTQRQHAIDVNAEPAH
jgi:hypothetical protein